MERFNTCCVCNLNKPNNTSKICRKCHISKTIAKRIEKLYFNCIVCKKEKMQNDSDRRYPRCFECFIKYKKQNSKRTDVCIKCEKQKKYTYNVLCKSCALSGIKPTNQTRKIWSEQRKGKEPPNKGKPGKSTLHTMETKAKISNSKTGLDLTAEQYREYLETQLVEGRREKLGKSNESKKWSFSIKQKFDYKCIRCESRKNLHAHHIKSWRHHPELRFDLDNGLCLCKDCHIIEHSKKTKE